VPGYGLGSYVWGQRPVTGPFERGSNAPSGFIKGG